MAAEVTATRVVVITHGRAMAMGLMGMVFVAATVVTTATVAHMADATVTAAAPTAGMADLMAGAMAHPMVVAAGAEATAVVAVMVAEATAEVIANT
jgi:hypothetical protein